MLVTHFTIQLNPSCMAGVLLGIYPSAAHTRLLQGGAHERKLTQAYVNFGGQPRKVQRSLLAWKIYESIASARKRSLATGKRQLSEHLAELLTPICYELKINPTLGCQILYSRFCSSCAVSCRCCSWKIPATPEHHAELPESIPNIPSNALQPAAEQFSGLSASWFMNNSGFH